MYKRQHYFTGIADPVLGQAVMLSLETDLPQDEVLPEVMDLSLIHISEPTRPY